MAINLKEENIDSIDKNPRVYLDYNATCPIKPEVQKVLINSWKIVGNASSVHYYGRQTRKLIEQARQSIADFFNSKASGIIFTSGATEANALALTSALKKQGIRDLYISSIEHDSVRATAQQLAQEFSAKLTVIPVNSQGIVTLEIIQKVLQNVKEKFLVCLMAANNETGVIQPLKEITATIHQKGGIIHCDAVQALGKIPLDFVNLSLDSLSCSGHKIGGPSGIGLLVKQENFPIYPLWQGGGQERGERSGTENSAAIIGLAEALKKLDESVNLWQEWQKELEESLQRHVPEVKIFGQQSPRLSNTSCFTMPGVAHHTQIIAFDMAGYALSAGAACSSGKVKVSHVLKAMGIEEEEAQTAIRLSWGWQTKKDELDNFVKTWYNIYCHQTKKNKDTFL